MLARKSVFLSVLVTLFPLVLRAASPEESGEIPVNAVTAAMDEAASRHLLDRERWYFDGERGYWKIEVSYHLDDRDEPRYDFWIDTYRKPFDPDGTTHSVKISGKAQALQQLETCPLPFIYHKKPPAMQGQVRYPLNVLKEVAPRAYEAELAKYQGREELLKMTIPKLGCLWNDVLHCSLKMKLKEEPLNDCRFCAEWFKR